MVEKTDYFRILVATCVGGIYEDLDTVLLKSPAQWITPQDILPWTDLETRKLQIDTADYKRQRARTELQALDPLTLTGPEAVTYAVKEWLNVSAGLRWNALTGLQDGGKAKLVDDVLILPITSFSPGRGKYGNMGSKPITDPTALVHHRGQGSWKKFNPVAEVGKICRTVFGLCEGWSKMQSST